MTDSETSDSREATDEEAAHMREILDYLPASAHEATKARVRQGGYTMHDCVICSAIRKAFDVE